MPREIKLRVWYPDEQTMMIPKILNVSSIGKDGGEWMEFTGIVDKNGKDVFEGDWCRACFRDKDGFHYKQGKIIIDDYMWCLDTMDENDEYSIYSINRLHDWEVLGNIYENPELLGNVAAIA
jgi:uncharacterized phage protein (TIGR01671 family)